MSNKKVYQARQWVKIWLANNGARYTFPSHGILTGGVRIRRPVDRLWLDAGECGFRIWGGRNGLEAAIQEWLAEQEDQVRSDLFQKISYRKELKDAELVRWVKALKKDADHVDVAVWRHWIWQVKRKLAGFPVELHLMPILVGKQEGGKSTAIRKLLAPISELVDNPSLAAVTDDRETFRLSRFAVMFFDEMEGAARADMEKLKNRITAETVSWRRLGTNEREQGPQAATFIGATNRQVVELLVDTTGMRRFYEMQVDDTLDWESINSVDYSTLWQSIDEAETAPLRAVHLEVRRRQNELVADDPVVDWLETRCRNSGVWTKAEVLYKAFVEWNKELCQRQISKKVFGERLKKLLGKDRWKKSGSILYQVQTHNEDEVSYAEKLLQNVGGS